MMRTQVHAVDLPERVDDDPIARIKRQCLAKRGTRTDVILTQA